MMNRRERRLRKRKVRRIGVAMASVAMLGATVGLSGVAYAGHEGSNSGESNGSAHYNAVESTDGTFHELGSLGTEHAFCTSVPGGRPAC